MNRRRYLTMSLGVVGSSFAGCTTLSGQTELTARSESHDDHSVRFSYDHDDKTLARVYFNTRPDTPWKSVNEIPETQAFHRLQVGTEQPGDVRLDSYRFQFKPAARTAANIYLHPPEAGHEETFDTHRDADWTVIEAEYDGGTPVNTGFEILVYTDAESDTESASILTTHELTLSGDRFLEDTFVARDQARIDLLQTG
jgi:hypothetical protein